MSNYFSLEVSTPWYADFVNYLVTKKMHNDLTRAQKDKLKSIAKYYVWDDPYLQKYCPDQIIRRCVPNSEFLHILTFCHSYACGGHLKVDFIGILCSKMHLFFANHVTVVKEQVT